MWQLKSIQLKAVVDYGELTVYEECELAFSSLVRSEKEEHCTWSQRVGAEAEASDWSS